MELSAELPLYERWFGMAVLSEKSAFVLQERAFLREALSRYYYAAYYATTAALLYRGCTLPTVDGMVREAWSHKDTPDIFYQQMVPVDKDRQRRRKIADMLANLYESRAKADYSVAYVPTGQDVTLMRKNAGYVLNYVEGILPKMSAGSTETGSSQKG